MHAGPELDEDDLPGILRRARAPGVGPPPGRAKGKGSPATQGAYHRKALKTAAGPPKKNTGSSQAAKWPPLSTSLK